MFTRNFKFSLFCQASTHEIHLSEGSPVNCNWLRLVWKYLYRQSIQESKCTYSSYILPIFYILYYVNYTFVRYICVFVRPFKSTNIPIAPLIHLLVMQVKVSHNVWWNKRLSKLGNRYSCNNETHYNLHQCMK